MKARLRYTSKGWHAVFPLAPIRGGLHELVIGPYPTAELAYWSVRPRH